MDVEVERKEERRQGNQQRREGMMKADVWLLLIKVGEGMERRLMGEVEEDPHNRLQLIMLM